MSKPDGNDKMADTPVTRSKKRTMDETPPKAGEPYELLSPGGTVTLGSPQEVQDPKKRLTIDNDINEGGEQVSKQQVPATLQGQGRVTNTNMATSAEVNKQPETTTKPSEAIVRQGDTIGDENSNPPEEVTNIQVPDRGRATARRGRPRKRAISLEPVVDKTDLMTAILSLRGDIGNVSQNQETLKGEMIKSLDNKIDELKLNLCKDVTETKTRVETNATHIDKLHTSQERLQIKVSDLDNKQDDISKDVMLTKRYIDDINLALSDQIGTVELGLAQDLETLKCNVEQNVENANHKHNDVMQKLRDFTVDIDIENGRLKMDVEAMRKVVEKLHQKNIVLDRLSSELDRKSGKTSCSSCSKCSMSSASSKETDSMSRVTDISDISSRSNFSNSNTLYLFGDTTKTIIVDKVAEKEGENLRNVIVDCFKDIYLNIEDSDIEYIERIGVYNKNKKWPRPVKVSFYEQAVRDQVLFYRTRLSQSRVFHEFQISKEEPKDVRNKRTKLRQAAMIARKKGHVVYRWLSNQRSYLPKIDFNFIFENVY